MIGPLFDLLFALQEPLMGALAQGFGVFLRVGAIVALMPAFGEQVIPVRVRLAIALAFTLVITPALGPDLPSANLAPIPLLYLITAEVTAGLALGIGLRLFVMALQIAGTIAAQATSLAQFFGGAGVDPQPAMSQILVVGGLALAVTLGLHVALAELILLSYQLFPPGQFPDSATLADWGVGQSARAFQLAFILSTPFVILSLLFYIALGAINKAMPQLMVAFVGAPAITWGGLAILLLTAPLMLAVWHTAFASFLIDPGATP